MKYYALCGFGGILSCGITHTAVVPLDLVKCRIQVIQQFFTQNICIFYRFMHLFLCTLGKLAFIFCLASPGNGRALGRRHTARLHNGSKDSENFQRLDQKTRTCLKPTTLESRSLH